MAKQYQFDWQSGALVTGVLLGGLWLQSGVSLAAQPLEQSHTRVQQTIATAAQTETSSIQTQLPAIKSPTANNITTIQYNGVTYSGNGILKDGASWVPITFLRDVLKMPLKYDDKEKLYYIGEGYRKFSLDTTDSNSLTLNGYYLNDSNAIHVKGHYYVPVQFLKQYLGYQTEWNAKDKIVNITSVQENEISFITNTKNEDSNGVDINLASPQVKYSSDAKVESAINQKLADKAKSFEEVIKSQLEQREKEKIDAPYSYSSSYIVTYNQNGIISLIVEQYGYTGGAHGMAFRKAFTFSLKDGKQLSIADVIGNSKSRMKSLSEVIKHQLEKDGAYMGGFEGIDNNVDFYIEPGNLKVYFQLYDYTAYAAGFPEFSFPLTGVVPSDSTLFR